jgi:hypothetical protein
MTGEQLPTQNEGSETGGADFIAGPVVTLSDRNRGARDRDAKNRGQHGSTSLSDTRGPRNVGPLCQKQYCFHGPIVSVNERKRVV